jgi:hypothetical protein
MGLSPATDLRGNKASYSAVALYGVILTLIVLLVYFMPRRDTDVAILVSPFADRATAANTVARADGRIIGMARWPFIVLSRPAEAGNTAFVSRLYNAGALVVFSPGVMAGCFKKE